LILKQVTLKKKKNFKLKFIKKKVILILISLFFSFIINITNFNANRDSSPLTLSITANIKQVCSVLISHFYFHNYMNYINKIGVVVSIIGLLFFSYFSNKKKK
jgi:hypothetical protein